METHWSLGVLIGVPLVIIFILVGVALILWGRWWGRNGGSYSHGESRALIGVGVAVIVITIGMAVAPVTGFYPYSAQYHQWQPKSGVVTAVNKRIVGGSDSISQKFVVRFKGSRQEYGCQDTRCAVIDDGDRVDLSCKRAWQYAGSDGWDCNFVHNGGAR